MSGPVSAVINRFRMEQEGESGERALRTLAGRFQLEACLSLFDMDDYVNIFFSWKM